MVTTPAPRVAGLVLATLQPTHTPRCRCLRVHSAAAGRRGEEQPSSLPLVEDATVLPPPATGSQYAWRSSWAGSASSGSGGGGRGGRSQARTRDWGRGGPGSSGLLLYLMYRVRILLLYGVWVTVLYGAVTGVADLSRKLGSGVAWAVTQAAAVTGLAPSSAPSSTSQDVAGPAAAAAGCAGSGGDGAAGAGSPEPGAAAAAAAEEAAASAAEAQSPLTHQQQQQQQQPVASGLRDRPAARFFNDWMSVVVPLYLVLLGSVSFFSTM